MRQRRWGRNVLTLFKDAIWDKLRLDWARAIFLFRVKQSRRLKGRGKVREVFRTEEWDVSSHILKGDGWAVYNLWRVKWETTHNCKTGCFNGLINISAFWTWQCDRDYAVCDKFLVKWQIYESLCFDVFGYIFFFTRTIIGMAHTRLNLAQSNMNEGWFSASFAHVFKVWYDSLRVWTGQSMIINQQAVFQSHFLRQLRICRAKRLPNNTINFLSKCLKS